MSRQTRVIAFALIVVFLAAGAAQAWPAAGARTLQPAPTEGVFAAAWDWMASLFVLPEMTASQGSPGAVPEKSGCIMDPDGMPLFCSN